MNASVSPPSPHVTEPVLFGPRTALVGAVPVLGWFWLGEDIGQYLIFLIGLGLGVALLYGLFGFAASYRAAFVRRDMNGVLAQIVMIALATLLFIPALSDGSASGAWAPLGLQVAVGAFLFGVGMQWGGACASGTLFSIGGGSLRMGATLVFFCLGAFVGSLHLGFWSQLPDLGIQTLGHQLGWGLGPAVQLGFLGLLFWGLKSLNRSDAPLWPVSFKAQQIWAGPWPLMMAAVALAGLNYATLMVAGHPWTVTWAFTLWGAKLVQAMGVDLSSFAFWNAPFQARALAEPLWRDTTSLMNMALVLGSFCAAFWSRRLHVKWQFKPAQLLAAILGGLLMGYGARLAYGCNIGALFSGVASTSLHGWVWLIFALAGTWLGLKMRPLFGLGTE